MTQVWAMELPAKQKLILLALADCANDEGLAWPSIATIARKCGCDERTVQRNLRDLETAGKIARQEVPGKGCKYRFKGATNRHPRQNDGATNRPKTPGKLPPKPSGTVTDLSNDKSKRAPVRKPDGLDQLIWDDWRRVRKKPVTATVMAALEREAAKLGWTVPQAITHAAESSWQGFKASWVEKDQGNGNRTSGNSNANAARLALEKLGLAN